METTKPSNATGHDDQASSSAQAPVSSNAGLPAEQQQDKHSPPSNNDAEQDEITRLARLSATVRDQNDLEKDVGRQADQMLLEQADERDQKRLDKALKEKE